MPGKNKINPAADPAGARAPAPKRDRVTSSDHLLRLLVTAGDVLPWDLDIALDRFRWAASPEWLLGALPQNAAGYPDLREIVTADDRARVVAALNAASEKLGPFQLEFRIDCGNGVTRNVLARGHSSADTGVLPTHVNGVLIDLGARAIAAAPASETPRAAVTLPEDQQALLNSLPDIAWIKDAKGRLTAVNAAFCRRHRSTPETALGKTAFDFYPRDAAARLLREDSEVLATRQPLRYETSLELDGHASWLEIVKAPLFNAAGIAVGVIGIARDISARKAAEQNLQDSERRFRMLAEMSSDWYWEQDTECRFTSITSRPNGVLDFKAMIGKRRWELPGEGVTPEQWRAHRATLEAHLPYHDIEYTSIQPGGARHRFLISGKPVYDERGKFAGYRGVGSDITARKAAEAELRIAKERLELALEGSRLALWDTNVDTGEAYLSEAWAHMLGMPPGETRTTTAELTALAHPDDVPEILRLSLETLRDERDEYMMEHRVRAADGSWRWIISRGRVSARDEKGRALRMSGTNLDITERREMESSLRLALSRSEVLLQTTPTAIALVRNRIFVRCNPAMERLFGAEPGALVNRSTDVLYPSIEDWLEAEEKAREALGHGEIFNEQIEFVRQNGERFWAVVAARELEAGAAEVLYTFTDVTAQQNLMRAMVRAKEMADAASQSKSSFLATMSHEIRTPMNGVLGMLELMEFTDLNSEQRESLTVARDSATALLRLIDDILDFSKIEAGQLEICAEPVSLQALAARAATVYAELATRKGLLLEHRVDPRIAPAHTGDGLRITQIINNLLSNAIKFTTRGKVTLEVESLGQSGELEQLKLTVRDTGIGVSADEQRRLFQPFVQANSSTTRNFGGTGLGLSICRRLAEMMGGNISMESAAGHGTTMTVLLKLPLADAVLLADRDSALREEINARNQAEAMGHTLGATILVADDHPVNLRLMERQATLLGYETVLAHDGVEALEKWKNGHFAMLLTDCHMPRMDGYELAREIRRIEAETGVAKPLPIIACTANALAGDAAACFEAGMNDYLSKPTTLQALKGKVEHWIAADAGARVEDAAAEIPAMIEMPAAALLDAETLTEFTGGDATLRREILRQFLAANEPDAVELRESIDGDDFEATTCVAHRIKGASRMIGAQPYADVAERIERAARNADRAALNGSRDEFEFELVRLTSYLQIETASA